MPAPKGKKTPSLRKHKPTGQAVVTIDAKGYYLGKHGSETARAAYNQLIAEWLANGRRLPPAAARRVDCTVNELVLAYWRHAQAYYVKDGEPTGEVSNVRDALRPLRRLYGRSSAQDFGPGNLKTVREAMIKAGLSRPVVNARVNRIRRAFKWGVEEEMIPPSVLHSLQAVAPLKRGRTVAREPEPVKPAPNEHVEATQQHLSRQVWALVQLQQLTGMRSGEVTRMRACDLDMSSQLWEYRMSSHKTDHHGIERVVVLGPKTQLIVRGFLKPAVESYLFSPADAERERREKLRRNRKTPITPSQAKRRRRRKPKRTPGPRYTSKSYAHAIMCGCKKAGVPHWHPHQLRHSFATTVRKEFGLDVARILLGHRSAAITETYAELDRSKAAEVVAKIG